MVQPLSALYYYTSRPVANPFVDFKFVEYTLSETFFKAPEATGIPIVIDNGSGRTKAGLATSLYPSVVIPAIVGKPNYDVCISIKIVIRVHAITKMNCLVMEPVRNLKQKLRCCQQFRKVKCVNI